MVVPGVVLTLIWGFFYDTNLGLLNQLLEALGLGRWRQAWLGDAGLSLYALMFMGFPWVGGFPLLIYYAGLQSIPTDVFDSARIDGAAGLSRFRHIDLPLLMGQVKLLLVLGFIGGLQGFQTQLLLTNGGPAYTTMVPGLHMYQNAITFDRMGYACAMGVVLFLVILGITYLNLKYLRSSQEFEA
jgi:ABC-type sugar transport system permease subunit